MNNSPFTEQKWDVDSVQKAIRAFALELESEDSPRGSSGEVSEFNLSAGDSSSESERSFGSLDAESADTDSRVISDNVQEAIVIESLPETKTTLTCFLRTKKGSFKQFEFTVENQMVKLTRPGSSKQQEFTYELDTVQAIIGKELIDD